MVNVEIWVTPLLLLPGVGILVLSTSTRYGRIHEEFHHLLDDAGGNRQHLARHLLQRSTLFRNAMVSLYISVGLFALAGLIGGLMSITTTNQFYVVWSVGLLTGLGIISLIFASIELIRESTLSLDVIREHYSELEGKG